MFCEICENIDLSLSNRENGRRLGVSESTIRRHKQKEQRGPAPESIKGTVDVTPEGGSINNVVVDKELHGDFSHIFEKFGLDPSQFEVVDDTVRMSTYQQSARSSDGSRDLVQLYSYSARFRKKTGDGKVDVGEALKQLRGLRKPRPRKSLTNLTRIVILSDLQIGKVDSRGGTPELLTRFNRLLAELEEECKTTKADDLVILDPGDLTEGFENTSSQSFTNDLSLPEQLDVARGVLTEAVGALSALHPGGTRVVTVPSNHAAWRSGKNYLGKPSDDFGILTHRSVEAAFELAGREDVSWVFPDTWSESVAVPTRGATIGMVHGHQFRSGKAGDWWAKQSHGNGPTAEATILVFGHWHNLVVQTSGFIHGRDRWLIGSPTMDNGSAWFKNISGEESEAGVVTFTVDDEGDWGNFRLIKDRGE